MIWKKHVDLVIFDWAGTMVDFGCEAPVLALLEAFGAEGVRIDEATARRDMGKAKWDHVRARLADPAIAAECHARHGRFPELKDVDLLMSRLEPLMRRQAALAATLIPGALQTFELLLNPCQRLGQRGMRGTPRLDLEREIARDLLDRLRRITGRGLIGAQANPILLQRCALRL